MVLIKKAMCITHQPDSPHTCTFSCFSPIICTIIITIYRVPSVLSLASLR
jgi:hypothetical protein